MGVLVISKKMQTLGKLNKIIGCEVHIDLREGRTLHAWRMLGKSWGDPQGGTYPKGLYGIKILKSVRIGKT